MSSKKPRPGMPPAAKTSTVNPNKSQSSPQDPEQSGTDRIAGLDVGGIRQEIQDLFEEFLSPITQRRQGGRPADVDRGQPLPLNVYEAENDLIVTVPLPGLTPEEIEISVRGQSLSVKAQRGDSGPDPRDYVRREWGYGPFIRTIDLPLPVEAESATATFRHGVVTLVLPKASAQRAQTVAIDSDDAEGDYEEVDAAEELDAVETNVVEESEEATDVEAAPEPEETSGLILPESSVDAGESAPTEEAAAPAEGEAAEDGEAAAAEPEAGNKRRARAPRAPGGSRRSRAKG